MVPFCYADHRGHCPLCSTRTYARISPNICSDDWLWHLHPGAAVAFAIHDCGSSQGDLLFNSPSVVRRRTGSVQTKRGSYPLNSTMGRVWVTCCLVSRDRV